MSTARNQPFTPPVRLTPFAQFLRYLPAGRGGSDLLGLGPLGGRGSDSRSGSGIPGGGRSIAPLTTGGGEASGGSLPLTTSGEAGLDGGNTLLLNTGELLLLNLLLGLSLGVAV